MTAKIYQFRPFKVPRPVENQFFQVDNTNNERFMEEDLARSGLTKEDIHSYITPFIKKEGATAAYSIPYFGLDGQPIVDRDGCPAMFRTRFKLSEFSKEQRYTQPSREQLAQLNLPPSCPYIHPLTLITEGDTLVCCEGEKKTLSVIKHLGLPAFGIGGYYSWRDPDRSGSVHRWILQLARLKGSKILIIPDGDIRRYDISGGYGTFAHALKAAGIDVEILDPGGKIDDLIVSWLAAGTTDAFASLPRLDPKSLVQSPDSLAARYNLAFKRNEKGAITVFQHSANITSLMKEHPAFPQIWLNKDTNRVMVGDVEARPDHTEMDIANYFQHNLGFDKVNSQMILRVVGYLAKENARSPMLDWVKGRTWDGVERLDTWMIKHWGVADTPYVREMSSKWLISACARMEKPGTKVDWMMIVIGPQGTGKTSMPGVVFRGNARPIYGHDNDKDLHMRLHSALCIGFDELDSFGKRETSNLKAMVTNHEDAFRPPYGASVEIFPRRFTLYGCGNRYEFLQHDPSGYRRYAIVEVNKLLDFSGLESDCEQLWAEAWQRYSQGGVKFWEVDGASREAEKYVIDDPQTQQMQSIIDMWKRARPTDKVKDNKLYITLADMQQQMGMNIAKGNSAQNREMGGIMRQLIGAPSNPTSGPKGKQKYYIVDLEVSE